MIDEPCTKTEDEVLAYAAGEMAEEEAGEMAEHLGDCPGCRDQAVEFRTLAGALERCCDEAVRWDVFETPFGTTFVAATADGLARVTWRESDPDAFADDLADGWPDRPVVRDPAALAEAERQLAEYFAGERTDFDLAVDLAGLTDFERRVLTAVREVGFGEVVPYAELARRMGSPKSARAVGNALHANPVTIVVPCHRVVRKDGSLGGYGAGVEYKRRLLAIEGLGELALTG